MEEIWKDIDNYEGLYKVSNLGNIQDYKRNLKEGYINNKGYCCISLRKNKCTKHFLIHRLVAKAFIENPYRYSQVNHKDGNKQNNCVTNLEWCNQRQNYDHGMKHFLYSKNENHYFAKLTNKEVRCIPELYKLGFTRVTVSRILNINPSSLEAIEKGISYRELNLDFNFPLTKYKDLSNIKLPSYIREIFKDNTVLNTLIAQGKVSV